MASLEAAGFVALQEFREKKIPNNPNDLAPGDLGCDSRAPRKERAKNNPGTTSCMHTDLLLLGLS